MALTDINSEDRLVQQTFADHLHEVLGWDSVYAWNQETFGPDGTLGRSDTTEVVLIRDLRAALVRLNPELPEPAVNAAVETLTRQDFSRSLLQHNQAFYRFIRDGVPVSYRDANEGRRCVGLLPLETDDRADRARASGSRSTGRVLAYPRQRQVVFDGLLHREGAPERTGQFHLRVDDGSQ